MKNFLNIQVDENGNVTTEIETPTNDKERSEFISTLLGLMARNDEFASIVSIAAYVFYLESGKINP